MMKSQIYHCWVILYWETVPQMVNNEASSDASSSHHIYWFHLCNHKHSMERLKTPKCFYLLYDITRPTDIGISWENLVASLGYYLSHLYESYGKVSYNLKRSWCNLQFFKLHFVENSIYKKILIDSLVRAFFGKNKYYASYREEYIYIYIT